MPVRAPLILPAAGASTRIGKPKGLLPYRGDRWLEAQLDAYRHADGTDVLLVLGDNIAPYEAALPWIREASHSPVSVRDVAVRVLRHQVSSGGSFHSIKVACRALIDGILDDKESLAFILPLDVPAPGIELWDRLEGELVAGKDRAAAVPSIDGHGGHPILLGHDMVRQIAALSSDRPEARLDHLLRDLESRDRLCRVPVEDPRVRMNLNTGPEWEAYVESGPPPGAPLEIGGGS